MRVRIRKDEWSYNVKHQRRHLSSSRCLYELQWPLGELVSCDDAIPGLPVSGVPLYQVTMWTDSNNEKTRLQLSHFANTSMISSVLQFMATHGFPSSNPAVALQLFSRLLTDGESGQIVMVMTIQETRIPAGCPT